MERTSCKQTAYYFLLSLDRALTETIAAISEKDLEAEFPALTDVIGGIRELSKLVWDAKHEIEVD